MVTRSCSAAADRLQAQSQALSILRVSLLLTAIATIFRPAGAVLSVNATRKYHVYVDNNINVSVMSARV